MKLIKAIALLGLVFHISVLPAHAAYFSNSSGSSTTEDEPLYEYTEAEEDKMFEQLINDFESSVDMDCVDFKVLGVCVWLTVTLWSIDIDYSPVISNYTPDAKVEVFHSKNDTPYLPAKLNHKVTELVGSTLGEAYFGFELDNLSSGSEGYRSAHVMGNPMLEAHSQVMKSLFDAMDLGYCGSNVEPFQTYFHSDIDFIEWRSGIMEMIFYPVNILRRVYSGASMWGSLYPRSGWTVNSSPYISASIAALRAGAIANDNKGDSNGLHVKTALPNSVSGAHKLKDFVVDEGNGKWQPMNIGDSYMNTCSTFPTPNVSSVIEPYRSDRSYYYTLWRKGVCCKREGSSLIASMY